MEQNLKVNTKYCLCVLSEKIKMALANIYEMREMNLARCFDSNDLVSSPIEIIPR